MRKVRLPPGPAVVDVLGPALADEDRARIRHPAAGAVILFARNYESPEQLQVLTSEIEKLRAPALPVCVDHEGGRVQRFREGFTAIPPMRELGRLWDRDREKGRAAAHAVGTIIGAELGAAGVDFSFAPVLDLDYGGSSVIGDRALHFDPTAVGALASEILKGLKDAGMAAVGKHFPGHGFATADSHVAVPRDEREVKEILRKDVLPYSMTIQAGRAGVMPAHVIFPQADAEPAGYSKFWLQEVLRGKLGFQGLVFSDDLSMEGACVAGGPPQRARAALAAGCDMVLLCNDPKGCDELLSSLDGVHLSRMAAWEAMRKKGGRDLRKSVAYREAQQVLTALKAGFEKPEMGTIVPISQNPPLPPT
ncbi:MAG: beta-N-acetylhexosaminidase [Betaproteobacteria bacterium]